MNQNDEEIRTHSDPKIATRCIIILALVTIVEVLFLFLAFSAWGNRSYGFAIALDIQAIISMVLIAIYMAANLSNSLVTVSFTEDGITCSLLGEQIKAFPWESIQYVTHTKSLCGATFGPHLGEEYREYCVFSTNELREEEKKKTLLNAVGQNGVAVIPYNPKLMRSIINQYGAFFRHACIQLPDNYDEQ